MSFKSWLISENSQCSEHGHFVLKHPDCLGYLLAFSPLSACSLFRHDRNLHESTKIIIEYLSKHSKVNREDLENLLEKHKIKEEDCRFKLQVVADIWSERQKLFDKFKAMLENHEAESLINSFSINVPDIGNVSGIAPSKSGMTVEMLLNIEKPDDVYSEDPYMHPDTYAERRQLQQFHMSDHHRIMNTLKKKNIDVNEIKENWMAFWKNLTEFLVHG